MCSQNSMSVLLEAFKNGTIFLILIKLELAKLEAHQIHHKCSTQGRILEKDQKKKKKKAYTEFSSSSS